MALPDRLARKAKRTDVDYAILSSGQQIPEVSSEDDSDDESYGSQKKKRRKQSAQCFICHRPSRTYKNTMLKCDSCSRLYHGACGRPFQSASILGNTSCYECLQEAKVLKKAKKIIVIAGAGISVSCGIPDFRSEDGIYAMARKMDVVLPEPECLFQIDYFRDDPAPFFEVVRTAFANSPKPSSTHWFLKLLQDKKKLLRVYTQNIDGLEEAAGVTRCIPCHGSFAYSACMRCKKRVSTNTLMPTILAGVIPSCPELDCRGVLKPEITFFGEILDDKVSTTITQDRLRADLLLVMGTSLKVAPVMEIPGYLPSHIPQVVINKTLLKKRRLKTKKFSTDGQRVSRSRRDSDVTDDEEKFDMSLLGDCDDITRYICSQAGWDLDPKAIKAIKKKPLMRNSQIISHLGLPGHSIHCFGECQCNNVLAANMNNNDDEEDNDEEEEIPEEDIVCNRCEERIETESTEPGSKTKIGHYRCNDCFDYDLCGDCYPKRRYKHKGGRHSFTQCL